MATTAASRKRIAQGREAEIFEYGEGRVLRLYRDGTSPATAEYQATVLRAAAAAGVRVPTVYGVETFEGRPAIVMERIVGDDILELIARNPWRIWSLTSLCARLQATLHDVTAPSSLPSTLDSHRRRISGNADAPAEYAAAALARLDTLPDGDRLLHGDFHPANVMLAAAGPVIIDWGNTTRGSPEADFARSDMMLHLGEPPEGAPWLIRFGARFARTLMIGTYNKAYRKARAVDQSLVRSWQLPVAVSRLSEGIAPERSKLLKLISELIARDA